MGTNQHEVIVMKPLHLIQAFAALLGLSLWLATTTVQAAPEAYPANPSETIKTEYQYAAKVVCSLLLPHQDGTLAKGTYRTIVNFHNPTDKTITVAAKVALAAEFGSEPGPFSVTPFKKAKLQADGAMELNCFDVAGYFCPINGVCVDFAFLEGFAVIKSPVPLDVVSVYSARHTDGEVETMDVETVQPKQIREAVKLMPAAAGTDTIKHVEYPPKGGTAYGGKGQGKEMCGGIAAIPCPTGKACVDDPSDDCNPAKGGADCSGICVSAPKKQ
jgi:hypothetical protein